MEVRAINVRSPVTGQISVLMELDKLMVKVVGNMAVQEEALKEKTTVKSALTVKEVATGQEIVLNQENNKVEAATKGRSFDLRFANNLR